MIRCIRLWTGDDGNSHFEEGVIDLPLGERGDILSGTVDCHQHLVARDESWWRLRMARRAGPPVRHHVERHPRLRDAHGRALRAAPGRYPACRGHRGNRTQLEACRRAALAPGLRNSLAGRRSAVRRRRARSIARLIGREPLCSRPKAPAHPMSCWSAPAS